MRLHVYLPECESEIPWLMCSGTPFAHFATSLCWWLLATIACQPLLPSHPSNECLAGVLFFISCALSSPQNGVYSSYLNLSKNDKHRRHKCGDIVISFFFVFTLRLKKALHRKIPTMYLSSNVVIPVCSFM